MIKKEQIKIFFTTLIAIIILITNITYVNAIDQGRISSTTGTKLRKGAGTTFDSQLTVPHNAIVTINTQNVPTSDSSTGCSTGLWHNITYQTYTGYVCSRYVEILNNSTDEEEVEPPTSDMATMTDEEFDAYLNEQGFPESYKVKLKELHKLHPNWIFVGVKTRDNWSTTLNFQYSGSRSRYQSSSTSSQGYLSTQDAYYNWYTDKFTAVEGTSWYKANKETIAYYLDPRNFLTETGIFMFEDLSYSPHQTSNIVKNILYTDVYKDYIQYFMEAGTTHNVSPTYLASHTRQEIGVNGGPAINGKGGDYCKNTSLNGYYNFYNIGAYSGVCDGLVYAKETAKWDTPQKAIVDGAKWMVDGYINKGQNTSYFKKWNVSINSKTDRSHQYMTNIRAPYQTVTTTKNTYASMNLMDLPFVFEIPVYDGIPNETSKLPPTGNPNNWLKELKVNNISVTNFDGEETNYTYNVPEGTKTVSISATSVNSSAKINGTGTIELTGTSTLVNIIVTAGNGSTRTYSITINKPEEKEEPETDNENKEGNEDNNENNNNNNENNNENNNQEKPIVYPSVLDTTKNAGYIIKDDTYITNITLGSTVQGIITKLQTSNQYASINILDKNNKAKTSGTLVTGDKITIVSNTDSKTYTVVIYGDNNGDGKITILDLANVQKHLLKKSLLTGAYLSATDTNKDGSITIIDLANFQKHLLKKSNISQS